MPTPEVQNETDLQSLMDALIQWRVKNPWASHIDFDKFPASVRKEIQRNADVLAGKSVLAKEATAR